MGGETLLTEVEVPSVSTLVVKTSWKIHRKHVLHTNIYINLYFLANSNEMVTPNLRNLITTKLNIV